MFRACTIDTGWRENVGVPLARIRRPLQRRSHPNEPNRHGWVVEVDPFDPTRPPVKRTAIGRMAHESAALSPAPDGRVAYYMGDDDFRSKFEHIYKFVSTRPYVPGGGYERNQMSSTKERSTRRDSMRTAPANGWN